MICIHADTVVIYNEDKDVTCSDSNDNSDKKVEKPSVPEDAKNGLKLLTE